MFLFEVDKKDGLKRVVLVNPRTKEKRFTRYSPDDFGESGDSYKLFAGFNNAVVNGALKWSINFGDEYRKFLKSEFKLLALSEEDGEEIVNIKNEYGEIISVQLRYAYDLDCGKKIDKLKEKLIEDVKEKKKEKRNKQYDSIKPYLNEEDFAAIEKLKEKEIVEKRRFFSVSGDYLLAGVHALEERISNLEIDQNEKFIEYFAKVDDVNKPLFFRVVKFAELDNKEEKNWVNAIGVDGLYDFMIQIGSENSTIYLKSLLLSLNRDENVWYFHDFTKSGLDKIQNRNDYFKAIYELQKNGKKGKDAAFEQYRE